jgi:hypothetical protein
MGGPVFFASILAEDAPQADTNMVSLVDCLCARPTQCDAVNSETENACAPFLLVDAGLNRFWEQLSGIKYSGVV